MRRNAEKLQSAVLSTLRIADCIKTAPLRFGAGLNYSEAITRSTYFKSVIFFVAVKSPAVMR